MVKNSKELAIAVLIGGKSTRFGFEKLELELFNKPLILHQVEILSEFDEDVYLVAHSEDQINSYLKNIKFSKEVKFIVDDTEIFPYPEIRTPILGVYSAFKELNNLGFKKAFLLAGDMPLVKANVIKFFINNAEGYDCCIPRWNNGFLETLFAIYPIEKTLNRAKELIRNKQYGLTKLLDEKWNVNYLSIEESIQPLDENLLTFININGPIDIDKVMRFYKRDLS